MNESYSFHGFLPVFDMVLLFYFCHSHWCVVALHYSLLGIWISFFVKCVFSFFAHLKNWIVFILLTDFFGDFYIFCILVLCHMYSTTL